MGYYEEFPQVEIVLHEIELAEPFNLENTLLSGQTFCWSQVPSHMLIESMRNTPSGPAKWFALADGGHVCLVCQVEPQRLQVLSDMRPEHWDKYFRASETPFRDAMKLVNGPRKYSIPGDVHKKLVSVMEESGGRDGIRVLNQDPWTTFVEFIISQRNSLKRIHRQVLGMLGLGTTVGLIVRDKGKSQRFWIGTMPTAEELERMTLNGMPEKLRAIGLGYRDNYLIDTAKSLIEESEQMAIPINVDADLDFVKQQVAGGKSSYKVLCWLETFKGVGTKVANCIALFGFGCRDVFPADVWIQRMIEARYVPEDTKILGNSAGEIQQYLFWYAKKHGIN